MWEVVVAPWLGEGSWLTLFLPFGYRSSCWALGSLRLTQHMLMVIEFPFETANLFDLVHSKEKVQKSYWGEKCKLQ